MHCTTSRLIMKMDCISLATLQAFDAFCYLMDVLPDKGGGYTPWDPFGGMSEGKVHISSVQATS